MKESTCKFQCALSFEGLVNPDKLNPEKMASKALF